ncbi:MAG: Ig-like domain-containing protein [Enorma sp.]|uniref:Ig-like domain-containing protein n=1 Tax=Enorma sp. TaxID=1920692 RepID=UPI00258A95AA|nr:Ig-like domain-containing protein [Enorma sp.]MCI7774615.1 Ig-like domain-containing protein [Enorma sp.]
MPRRTIWSVLAAALLCLVMLPATALAVETNTVYVGGVALTGSSDGSVYATTNENGEVITEGATADNYNIKWDGNTLTLKGAYITKEVSTPGLSSPVEGAAIGVYNQSGDANLTITLEGTNTIEDVSYGICVLALSTGSANLTITGSDSLTASGSSRGIQVQSHNGDAAVSIQNAKVTATAEWASGVNVRCGTNSSASLTVNGGNLTSSGSQGILYDTMESSIPSTIKFIVSNSALVDARGGGIGAGNIWNLSGVSPTDGSVGIVFGHDRSDSKAGTVYGDVTLQEDLEIGEGESLTLDDGANLSAGDHNVIVDGGTLDESLKTSLGDRVTYVVRGVSLDRSALTLIEGGTAQLTATVEPIDATNKKVTWSSSAPGVATVDASGNVTAVAEGTATITATTDDGGKTATCTVTVEHAHDPAAAWSSDASGHWHACAGCSEKLNIAAHSGKVVGKRDATCTEAGFTGDTVCSICGYVVAKGVATAATDHSYQNGVCTACGAKEPAKDEDAIPATGDLAPMACALAGIFGMALVAAGLRNRTSW